MLEELIGVAKKAGEAILEFYDEDIDVVRKDDDSPLTKADMASHRIIVNALKEIDPDTPVISEESGVPAFEKRREWTKFWIVDPLDGTKEFIKKNDEFTVNIALIDGGKPVIGIVYIPAADVTYFASREKGAFKQIGNETPRKIFSRVSDKNGELKAVQSRSHGSDSLVKDLAQKGINIHETIPAGSSLKFCLVAEGKADIYPRLGPTMEWDVAAGDCVYRYSAKEGEHASPLTYNKPDLKNKSFLIGMRDSNIKLEE